MSSLRHPHTVTFDCWATLLYELDSGNGPRARARILADATGEPEERAGEALARAWRHHAVLWHQRRAFTGADMTRQALAWLGIELGEGRRRELIEALETQALHHQVQAIDGARETLEALVRAGVRRALICDTGFTPGRVVVRLLERVGLAEHLEVRVFSDEVGVPKPEPGAFAAALDGLGVPASGAVHVGDLRRSDVAGARRAAMGSVRIRVHNDDAAPAAESRAGVIGCEAAGCRPECERPEADAVVDSYAELRELLGVG